MIVMSEEIKNKYRFTIDKLIPLNEVIKSIEEYNCIDGHLGYEDGFEIDSILYYLRQNKQLQQLNQIIYIDKSEKILNELEKWLESNINELSNIICEDNINRISTTYEETKKETYQKVLEKSDELRGKNDEN